MESYVEPFEVRVSSDGSNGSHDERDGPSRPDDWDPTLESDEDEQEPDDPGLAAIEDDLEHGRREAPFADDPDQRVRPVDE